MDENPDKIIRREFLGRCLKAGLSIAAAGAAYRIFLDKRAGEIKSEDDSLVSLPDFSVPSVSGQSISIVRGSNRANTVNKAIELLGGISRFIKQGDVVVIKPNIAFAAPAILGATSNPELIGELTRLCYSAGAKEVIIADNPINDPASCFAISGISQIAQKSGAKVMLPKDGYFKNFSLKDARLITDWPLFFEPLRKANKLIGVAPVKHHNRSGASLSMKNWYGLLGGRRNVFHQDINGIITELAMMVKPTFVVLDGTQSMMTNGPTGGSVSDLKNTDTMIVSTDMVAADTFGCSLLGIKPSNLPYLEKAKKAGVGTTDIESLKPIITQVS